MSEETYGDMSLELLKPALAEFKTLIFIAPDSANLVTKAPTGKQLLYYC